MGIVIVVVIIVIVMIMIITTTTIIIMVIIFAAIIDYLSSAITTNVSAHEATIFSCVRQPLKKHKRITKTDYLHTVFEPKLQTL